MVRRNIKEKRLFLNTNLGKSIQETKIIFICVGTPSAKDGTVDLGCIKEVAEEIGKNIRRPKIIVIKSTVPMGTVRNLVVKIISKYWKGNFEIASNPEFLREGNAVFDFLNPDRVVIGVNSSETGKVLVKLYRKIKCPKIITTLESAEMIKYASNAFLATKISFINEIANICEKEGADVEEVARGIGLDKRIGPHFLKAGIGWGGSCFPKDLKAFRQIAGMDGYNFRLLKSTIEVNNYQKKRIIGKIKSLFPSVKNKKIALLGLAFKENTDDVRESPALEIAKKLQRLGAVVKGYDPKAIENAKKVIGEKAIFCNSPYQAVKGADAVIIATEWRQFKYLNWKKIKNLLNNPLLIDGRNLMDPLKMKKIGFRYIGVGRNYEKLN